MRIEIIRTGEEAKREAEQKKREEKMSRTCPECGKYQWFSKKVTKTGIHGTWYKAFVYNCSCGCSWRAVS